MLVAINPTWPQSLKDAILALEKAYAPYVLNKPLTLVGYATGNLPAPAVWPRSLAYNTTLNRPVFSNGVIWITL